MNEMNPLTERRRKELATLVRRRGRDETGLFLVEGVRSVESAIAAGARLQELVVSDSASVRPEVIRLMESAGIPVLMGRDHDVARIGDVQADQGVIGVAELGILTIGGLDRRDAILALDGVQDPGNVGTILRSAAWFGIRSVVAGSGTADWYSPKVVRASMGAIWDLDLVQTDDLPGVMEGWAAEGRELWVADMQGSDATGWRPAEDAVLVLGSEAHGPSSAVKALATGSVTIGRGQGSASGPPTRHPGTESLNVSAATAVLLYAWKSPAGA